MTVDSCSQQYAVSRDGRFTVQRADRSSLQHTDHDGPELAPGAPAVMTLTAGFHLGPYEIVAPLGAGGMGEVYRPRDTKLDRDGALKILPELSRPIPIGSRVSSGKQSCKAVGGLDTVRAKSL